MKFFIFSLLLTLLISCGNNFKIYTKSEKTVVVDKIFKNDSIAKKQYEEITSKLKKEMDNGNSDAKKELEEWESIFNQIRVLQNPKPSEGKDSGILNLKRNN